jgi:hypothetical protein
MTGEITANNKRRIPGQAFLHIDRQKMVACRLIILPNPVIQTEETGTAGIRQISTLTRRCRTADIG